MQSHPIRLMKLVALAVPLAAGCEAPPAGPASQPSRPIEAPIAWETDLGAPPPGLDWRPVVGRASADLLRRHGLRAGPETVVLDEGFDRVTSALVPGWHIVGFPSIRPIGLDGAAAMEMRSPVDVRDACGLERPLDAAALAGRDVRVDIRMTCRSFLRVEALEKTRISVIAVDKAGRSDEVVLPLEAGVSPGWEWQSSWLYFSSEVASARIRILATAAGGILTVDAIRLAASDPLAPSRPAEPSRPANLVIDGDFEAGSVRFFASAAARWPGGQERILPLSWQILSETDAGGRALSLDLSASTGRVGFGPLNLNPAVARPAGSLQRVFLAFSAKASLSTVLVVSLRTQSGDIGRGRYILTPQWQRFTGSFQFEADTFERRLDLTAAELVFEFISEALPEPNTCWLDGVVLQADPIVSRYVPRSAVEVGLSGIQRDSTDLANLFDVGQAVAFVVRLAGESAATPVTQPAESASARPVGRLAIDLADAWDRVVARQTREVSLPPGGVWSQLIEAGDLPRGYYRVMATLWAGEPGTSTLISQASMPLAVIGMNDAVPARSPFGLTSRQGNISPRTTQLGVSWVRLELPSRWMEAGPTGWDFAAWQSVVGQCRRAQVDFIADVELPAEFGARQSFLEQWLQDEPFLPIGVVVRPPAIGRLSGRDYLQQLEQVRGVLARRSADLRVVEDLSYLEGLPDATTPADG
ncbi:MAG TPA: hypothetical protein VLM89_17675, partial [Phycisphaerae bacterium]|nr:hypothetical protein [Phycisphaerae bacterium]